MKKVAIYVRVSTINKGQDLETQIIPLKEYCQKRGWEIYRIFEEKESGAKDNRPVLKELMTQAHKRQFDCVVVYRFDRFSRSSIHLLSSLETFGSLGIDFCSYQENMDTTTPMGKAMFTMASAFAEFERSIIQERVRDGINKARIKGKILGRPKVPLDIQKLFQLKSDGLSIRKIAGELGVPKSTVQNYIKA